MATAVPSPAAVELFYSYAHSDERLCEELRKHLTALKRSGLISDWYDRKIEPGNEWRAEIQDAMERAGIILLLVSADFLASKFIFEVELPFALKRHDAGSARVIPVLLRPVEWHDSPFAKLQVLPSEARAVTLWPNQDEAFSDIAGKLREVLYDDRLGKLAPGHGPVPTQTRTQQRVLDAAIASSVVIDEPTDVVTMVRAADSGGLKMILKMDRSYSPTSDDVRSNTFELDFPVDEFGGIKHAGLELALESPGFDPPVQRKRIRVPPTGDSSVLVFMLTPRRAGTLRLNLEVLSQDIQIGSRVLVTMAVRAADAQPTSSYSVTSLPLLTSPSRVRLFSAPVASAKAPASAPIRLREPGVPFPDRPRFEPKIADERKPSPPNANPTIPARSKRGVWIGVASSAAALVVVSTAVLMNIPQNGALQTPDSAPRPAAIRIEPPTQGITALNEAINRQPNEAALYLQRAKEFERSGAALLALADAKHATELAPADVQAHVFYAQLLEKANLNTQALQEYKNIQALHPSSAVHAHAAEKIDELERRQVAKKP